MHTPLNSRLINDQTPVLFILNRIDSPSEDGLPHTVFVEEAGKEYMGYVVLADGLDVGELSSAVDAYAAYKSAVEKRKDMDDAMKATHGALTEVPQPTVEILYVSHDKFPSLRTPA